MSYAVVLQRYFRLRIVVAFLAASERLRLFAARVRAAFLAASERLRLFAAQVRALCFAAAGHLVFVVRIIGAEFRRTEASWGMEPFRAILFCFMWASLIFFAKEDLFLLLCCIILFSFRVVRPRNHCTSVFFDLVRLHRSQEGVRLAFELDPCFANAMM